MTILEPNTHPSASTASPSGGSHESPRYTAKDSLVYLRHLVEVLRDCAFDSLPDDDHPQSPHDELIHELADKLHEITKVVRREAQAHGSHETSHYSNGRYALSPGKVWHPLEAQS